MFYRTIIFLFIMAAAACLMEPQAVRADNSTGDYVILLHGLGRTRVSMWGLEKRLAGRGFRVINLSYPSTDYTVGQLAGYLKGQIDMSCSDEGKKIHFVTHSMGGIILRWYLKENRPERLGRVVMLGPPNRGSELVDLLGGTFFFQIIEGPAGEELGTGDSSVPNSLGRVDFELGVITGNRSLNPVYSLLIPGEDDGKVSVERAKVEGMADFLIVPHSHSYIMNGREVADQIEHFLHHGRFRHQGEGKQ